jgi:hypothetical protein
MDYLDLDRNRRYLRWYTKGLVSFEEEIDVILISILCTFLRDSL